MSTIQQRQGIITVTDFCDVSERARFLGLNNPEGLAFLPRNFEHATTFDELLHEDTVDTLRALFRNSEIPETRVEQPGQKIPVIVEKSFDLVCPAFFVGGVLFSENPHLLSLALSIVANYATDFFKGTPGPNEVTLSMINAVEKEDGSKVYKKVEYKGPVEGMAELRKTVGKVFTNEETS